MNKTREEILEANKAFGQVVKDIRADRGWLQAELAEKLGESAGQISVLERGLLGYNSKLIKRMKHTSLFTEYERELLQSKHKDMWPGDTPPEERRDEYRIKNVPGFYDLLNSLEPLSELDENDPRLEVLRTLIGQGKSNKIKRKGGW